MKKAPSAPAESLYVVYRYGRAYSCLLTREGQSTCEYHGAKMRTLLSELSLPWRPPVATRVRSSSQTSLAFAKREDASSLATTLRQARRRA